MHSSSLLAGFSRLFAVRARTLRRKSSVTYLSSSLQKHSCNCQIFYRRNRHSRLYFTWILQKTSCRLNCSIPAATCSSTRKNQCPQDRCLSIACEPKAHLFKKVIVLPELPVFVLIVQGHDRVMVFLNGEPMYLLHFQVLRQTNTDQRLSRQTHGTGACRSYPSRTSSIAIGCAAEYPSRYGLSRITVS